LLTTFDLKVYSWEPVKCHDSVEMGWSTLSDLCIHDGKLVGGAYYQNYVGVWVADVSVLSLITEAQVKLVHGFSFYLYI